MPKITFITPDGERHELQAKLGSSVMHVAIDAGIDGIHAECGGAAACGTCHVYADEQILTRLVPPESNEEAMLDYTVEPRQPNSRLSCQLLITDDMEGAVFTIAARQV